MNKVSIFLTLSTTLLGLTACASKNYYESAPDQLAVVKSYNGEDLPLEQTAVLSTKLQAEPKMGFYIVPIKRKKGPHRYSPPSGKKYPPEQWLLPIPHTLTFGMFKGSPPSGHNDFIGMRTELIEMRPGKRYRWEWLCGGGDPGDLSFDDCLLEIHEDDLPPKLKIYY